MLLAPALLFIVSSLKIVSGAEWCYESEFTCGDTCANPQEWDVFSLECSGTFQSPVNIVTKKSQVDKHLTPFSFSGYQETFEDYLFNSGHSVQLNLPSTMRIEEGNLSAPYKPLQLHLHWGEDGGPGSEHMIDGEQFPMEMHIVHIKEEYNSLDEALPDPTGVAVLGFFFEESNTANKKYDPLINALEYITQPDNGTTLSGISLEMLIPSRENMTKYFRYSGSLTTPNCAESVVWTLFENPIFLSREQLTAFSQILFSDGTPMVKNYRPLQPMNGRQVYYSSGHVALVSAVLLIMSVLVSSALCLHTTG